MAKINNVLSIVKSAFKGSDVQLIPHKRSPKKVIYYLVQIFDKLDDPRKEFKITYPLQVKRMRRNEMLVNTEFDVQKIESNFYATKSYYCLLFRPLMRLTCIH